LQRFHQLDDPFIRYPVVDEIGIFTKIDDSLVAQDIEVLGDIGTARFHSIPDFADRQLAVLEQAEYLEANGM